MKWTLAPPKCCSSSYGESWRHSSLWARDFCWKLITMRPPGVDNEPLLNRSHRPLPYYVDSLGILGRFLMIWDFGSSCILKKSHGKRLFSTNQMAGNSKTVSLLKEIRPLSKETIFEFSEQRDFFLNFLPFDWLKTVSFHETFLKCIKSQNLKSLGTVL